MVIIKILNKKDKKLQKTTEERRAQAGSDRSSLDLSCLGFDTAADQDDRTV
jgi:hypothetical protein